MLYLSSSRTPRHSEAFRRLDSTIKQFAMSLPREYSTPDAVLNPDGRVAIVVTLPHVAKILLYERLCTMSAPDSAMATCIAAARAVMSTIYMLYSTSFEISKLTPFLNSCWVVVGRELLRTICTAVRLTPALRYDQARLSASSPSRIYGKTRRAKWSS